MQNRHRNVQREGSFPFNLNAMSIMTFCRAIDSGDAPAAEADMFSRWIKLSDDLLAANWKPRKRGANRSRSKFQIAFSPNPA